MRSKAQAVTSAAGTALAASTMKPRRRRGTIANHTISPMTSATSEPREYDSMIVTRNSPIAGKASALTRAVAPAPGAQPQRRGNAQRGGEAGGVPVAERLAQARVVLVRGERAREDLGHERVAAHHDRAQQHAGEQRGPAARDQPDQRDAAGEDSDVAERAIGLDPGVRRLDRPRHRCRRPRRQGDQRGEREAAPEAAAEWSDDDRRRGQPRPQQRGADLDGGRAAELQPALRAEGGADHGRGDEQRDRGVHPDPRKRDRPPRGRGPNRDGG